MIHVLHIHNNSTTAFFVREEDLDDTLAAYFDSNLITYLNTNYEDKTDLNKTVLMGAAGEYYDDLRFPAQAINPAGAVAAPSVDSTETGFPGTLLFSGTLDHMVALTAQMSHTWKEGSSIYPHLHWAKTTSAAGDNVTWELYYRFINKGAAPGAWFTAQAGTMVVNHNGIAEAEAITAFPAIDMTGRTISQNIAIRIYRRGSSDAYNSDARLFEFDIHYLLDRHGSEAEFVKV